MGQHNAQTPLAYDGAELRKRFEEMRTKAENECNGFLAEIDTFNFTYEGASDLDRVTPEMLYADLARLRAWRNRLAQIIRVVVRHQCSAASFLARIADLHKAIVDKDLIDKANERISRGWAIQERLADAGLMCLDLRKIVVETTNFCDFVKAVLQVLNEKRHELRDACQEVQVVQGLMALSMGTAE